MPLPIIMIFERHWDKIPKLVLKKMLPKLAEEGYDTLCLEAPQDLTTDDLISQTDSTIIRAQEIYAKASSFLEKAEVKIEGELSDLSYSELAGLLCLHVSSQKYWEIAEKIKNLPAGLLTKEIFTASIKLSMSIEGVDIKSEDFYSLVSGSVHARRIKLDENENRRNGEIFKNLIKISKERKGIIFLCGGFHASTLISFFKKIKMEDQIIYCFPHSNNDLAPLQ